MRVPKGNAILVTKQASDSEIDPLMVVFNAIALYVDEPVVDATEPVHHYFYSGKRHERRSRRPVAPNRR